MAAKMTKGRAAAEDMRRVAEREVALAEREIDRASEVGPLVKSRLHAALPDVPTSVWPRDKERMRAMYNQAFMVRVELAQLRGLHPRRQ